MYYILKACGIIKRFAVHRGNNLQNRLNDSILRGALFKTSKRDFYKESPKLLQDYPGDLLPARFRLTGTSPNMEKTFGTFRNYCFGMFNRPIRERRRHLSGPCCRFSCSGAFQLLLDSNVCSRCLRSWSYMTDGFRGFVRS